MIKDIYYLPYKFQYDTETKVLKSLNGATSITNVPEEEIDNALEMAHCMYCPKLNVFCSYETLLDEYDISIRIF